LGLGDSRAGDRFTIRAALHESVGEGPSCLLARFRRRKEELLQNSISLELRIAKSLRQRGFSRCMMSSPPRGAVPTKISTVSG
jgi:hypothetical protein